MGAEEVREVELGGGALLHADRGAVELERRIHLQRLAHHEALAVVVVDAGEVQAERGVARRGPGGVAHQHVDLARLQRGEAVLGRQRHEFDFAGVVEDGRGDGAADIDVEPGPFALRVGQAEAGERAVGAAIQDAAVFHRLQRLRGGALRDETTKARARSWQFVSYDDLFDAHRASVPRDGSATHLPPPGSAPQPKPTMPGL